MLMGAWEIRSEEKKAVHCWIMNVHLTFFLCAFHHSSTLRQDKILPVLCIRLQIGLHFFFLFFSSDVLGSSTFVSASCLFCRT